MKVGRTTIRFLTEMAAEGFLPIPPEACAELPEQRSVTIEGTVGGFPFRAPTEADAEGGRRIPLTPAQQNAAGAKTGVATAVEITRIGDTAEVLVPADLLEALAAAPQAQALWAQITPMARREWVRWIASAKQPETRIRRIEVGIDKLLGGMRRPCCFPGLNWVTRDHVGPEETWQTLPGGKSAASSARKA